MSTEEIISGIYARRASINKAEDERERARDERMRDLETKIKALAPRLGNLFDVARVLTENGFYLGPREGRSPKFCTDHIDHRVGFYCEHPYLESPSRNFSMTGYFGIAEGGAGGNQDLKIDRQGNIKPWDLSPNAYCDYKRIYIEDLQVVVDMFDKFEADFYQYAKNPIPRSRRY